MIIRMPIDLKSLYQNIKNDNQTGHTPTVATPLRQGKSVHAELAQIEGIPERISQACKDRLSLHLLSKSRADAKITRAFVFNRISVNGELIEVPSSYCIYIREETNPQNVHFGRQKVHYPQVLEFDDDEISINNYLVMKEVSRALHDYAFLIQAFEYDDETEVLNFDALIVGENGVPYSKVFLNKRGVGDKFASIFNEYADIYDTEIIAMRNKLGYDAVSPDNFMSVMAENKTRAINAVLIELSKRKNQLPFVLYDQYPYSLFDIVLRDGEKKTYVIVRFTSTNICYFNLPSNCISFIGNFPDKVELMLVTDVNGDQHIHTFKPSDLNNMKKIISSVTYETRGD